MQHVCLFYSAVNYQTPSLRLDVSLLRDNINIFINVSYLCMLNICVYKIYSSMTLSKIKFHIKYFLEPSFITLEGTHDLYLFRNINVFGIMLSCLLHNDFYSCLYLYSCMVQGSVGHVSCIGINRKNATFLHIQLTICMQPFLKQGTHPLVLLLPTACCQWRNTWFGLTVNDTIL